jgi:hypothetical protein
MAKPGSRTLQLSDQPRKTIVRWAAALVRSLLFVLIVVGVTRERRAANLTRSFLDGLAGDGSDAEIVEVNRRVAERMKVVHERGAIARPAKFPLHTWADHLLEGGESCGLASAGLASILDQAGHQFRIIQINVDPVEGARHIMVEARTVEGRWVLLDPLFGVALTHPTTGRLMSIEEARALSPAEFAKLPIDYRERWSLQAPYRRTNWKRFGPLRSVLAVFLNEEHLAGISVRAWTVEPGGEMAMLAGVALVLSFVMARVRRERVLAAVAPIAAESDDAPDPVGAE